VTTARFRVDLLPARRGDCLWIEYGDPQHPQRLLIDGGTRGTVREIRRRLRRLPADQRRFELLVVTHVDADHIEGVLELLGDPGLDVSFDDIWFNGWRHLPGSGFEDFGPVQGERLTTLLDRPAVPWNEHEQFSKGSVSISEVGPLPTCMLPDGMKLTLLSPGAPQLAELRPVWERECRKAGLDPSQAPPPPPPVAPPSGFEAFGPPDVEALANAPFEGDGSEANGTTIAMLAEFDGRRVLLAGDAYADVLLDGLRRLVGPGENDRLQLDAFKLPHHGSKANINREILAKVDCPRYLFSTNGGGRRLRHPNQEAVARVIKFGGQAVQLIFNYRQVYNAVWDDRGLMERYGYSVSYPAADHAGQTVDL
jgi:hypothetical protein